MTKKPLPNIDASGVSVAALTDELFAIEDPPSRERPRTALQAAGRNQLGRIERGVIDHMIDDVEGWRVVTVLGTLLRSRLQI